jgi:hypothetical protein
VGGSASDMTATPAYALKEKLEQAGLQVRDIFYDGNSVDVETIQKQLLGTVLFVSASRTRLKEQEIGLAQMLARSSQTFIHIALWNPYNIHYLPQPAILSFGFQETALTQVVSLLLGAVSKATLPFELKDVTT